MPLSLPATYATEAILHAVDQQILLFDARQRLVSASSHFAHLLKGQANAEQVASLLEGDYPVFQRWLALAEASPDAVNVELLDIEKESSNWRFVPIYDAASVFRGYALLGSSFPVQDRLKLESELRISHKLIEDQKMALDESSIVAVTDKAGVIQYVNDIFCRISGYERHELIGKTHAVVKSGYHGPEFFKEIWSTISSGRAWKGEIKNKAKDGSFYWVDTTIVPFLNDKGRPYQYIAIRNDITEKKSIQESLELEQVRAMHAEKMASLGRLAAGIAHELGNPIASINAWLDIIELQHERGDLNLTLFTKMIPQVKRDANRIREILRGMLTYARDGSRDPFQLENPYLLVNQMVESCAHRLKRASIDLRVSTSNPYLVLECRATEISQLFVIFILNSCDAVENLAERWIRIDLSERDAFIDIAITDSGRGIPAEVRDAIFNPFFTTKPVGHGTGLGLSIAQSIAENHQGSVRLDTGSEHTRFVISLPQRHET